VFSWFGCIDELVFGNNSFLDYVFVFLILGVFNVILCVFSFLLSIGLMFPCVFFCTFGGSSVLSEI
jgi:hypothetical protein